MLTFCVKLGGNVVDRNCFWRAEVDDIDAVPLMLGILLSADYNFIISLSADTLATRVAGRGGGCWVAENDPVGRRCFSQCLLERARTKLAKFYLYITVGDASSLEKRLEFP